MRSLFFLVLISIGFNQNPAFAEMTITDVSGYSVKFTESDSSVKYYAAMAGTCTGSETCDTCTGDALKPCSRISIGPNTQLSIRATFTGNLGSTSNITVKSSTSGDGDISGKFNFTLNGTTAFTAAITWGDLCGNNCVDGLEEQTLTFSIDGANDEADQSAKVTIGASYIDTQTQSEGWFYDDCSDELSTSGNGWCSARVKPGDDKVYFEDLVYSDNYPGSGSSEYKKVILFYENATEGESDAITIGRITNGSPSTEIDITKTEDYQWTQKYVGGLSNGKRVCFRMANQDATGIIKYFTPETANPENWCTTPSNVVGLLDGKSCFIATAAYGSVMAPEVEWIRKFRNEFLLTHSWGQNFVKFYYKSSPPLANWITRHEWARTTARTFLWPVLAFSWISVNYGLLWALVFAVGLAALGVEVVILLRRQVKRWSSN